MTFSVILRLLQYVPGSVRTELTLSEAPLQRIPAREVAEAKPKAKAESKAPPRGASAVACFVCLP